MFTVISQFAREHHHVLYGFMIEPNGSSIVIPDIVIIIVMTIELYGTLRWSLWKIEVGLKMERSNHAPVSGAKVLLCMTFCLSAGAKTQINLRHKGSNWVPSPRQTSRSQHSCHFIAFVTHALEVGMASKIEMGCAEIAAQVVVYIPRDFSMTQVSKSSCDNTW